MLLYRTLVLSYFVELCCMYGLLNYFKLLFLWSLSQASFIKQTGLKRHCKSFVYVLSPSSAPPTGTTLCSHSLGLGLSLHSPKKHTLHTGINDGACYSFVLLCITPHCFRIILQAMLVLYSSTKLFTVSKKQNLCISSSQSGAWPKRLSVCAPLNLYVLCCHTTTNT